MYEKNSRIHLDRWQNKFTHCKGIRNSNGSRQTTGIPVELDTKCKQNVSRQTTQDNETLFPNLQNESWKASKETSRYVRPERVNKWPNSMTDIRWWWWWCTVVGHCCFIIIFLYLHLRFSVKHFCLILYQNLQKFNIRLLLMHHNVFLWPHILIHTLPRFILNFILQFQKS